MQGFPNSSGGGGGAEILLGEFFYQVVRTWGGVTLASDSKLKKKHAVNTEHQLKSTLVWPVCQKTMKLKQKWYRSNDWR